MPLKVFQKFGLKRDLNLADLPAKRVALNNLLDGLTDSFTSFTWEDIALLKDVYLSKIRASTFTRAADATVLQIQPDGRLLPYDPIITLENRFDKAYFTTSEPYFAGGDGLTATYYDNGGILRSTEGDPFSEFTGLNDDFITQEDDFWERGYFVWENKLSPRNRSQYGAIKYEGYIKPYVDGVHYLTITTRGFFKVEFDDKTEFRDFTYDPETEKFNYNNYNFTNNADTGGTGGLITYIDHTKLNSPDLSNDLSTAVVNGTSTRLGDNRTFTINLGSLVQWDGYKIRLTFFIDESAIPENTDILKYYQVSWSVPNGGSPLLNYKNLFTKNYFQNYDIGDFRAFVEDSISLAGTQVGLQGTIGDTTGTFTPGGITPTLGDSYANVNNFSPIVSYYSPPNSIADVEEVVSGCTYTTNNSTVSISNSEPNSTEFIEVGNYVFGSGITPGTRVTKVVVNTSVVIYPPPVGDGSGDLTFVDHRGIAAFGNGDVSQHQITNITNAFGLNDILKNQIVLSDGLSFTYNDDTTIPSSVVQCSGKLSEKFDSSTGTISFIDNADTTLIGTLKRFYIYQSSGLVDDGLKFFCQGVFKARLLQTQSDISSNSVVLNLDSVENIQVNDWVHAFPAVNFGQRADGSVQELFSKVQVTSIDPGNNQITITNKVDTGGAALLTTLEYIPAKVKNIVFTSNDVNREVCFKPTDTSPPFAANSTGLVTSNGVKAVNNFTSQSGGGVFNPNSVVAYNDLEIRYEFNVNNNIISYSGSETISKYIPIEDSDGNTFYMMLGD